MDSLVIPIYWNLICHLCSHLCFPDGGSVRVARICSIRLIASFSTTKAFSVIDTRFGRVFFFFLP